MFRSDCPTLSLDSINRPSSSPWPVRSSVSTPLAIPPWWVARSVRKVFFPYTCVPSSRTLRLKNLRQPAFDTATDRRDWDGRRSDPEWLRLVSRKIDTFTQLLNVSNLVSTRFLHEKPMEPSMKKKKDQGKGTVSFIMCRDFLLCVLLHSLDTPLSHTN